jgi:acyl dehydratase
MRTWESLSDGEALPDLIREATTRQLVQYAGASGDFYEIHYDKDVAAAAGHPGVVVHGALKSAWLIQMALQWAGPGAEVRALKVRYRAVDLAHQPIICRGRVSRTLAEGGRRLVECEVWTENPAGERTTDGSVTLSFGDGPAR